MGRVYRDYNIDQSLLLPPDLREWLPEGHLALFLHDLVAELDLHSIFAAYEGGDGRGKPPYHPRLLVALLLYAYCLGIPSSRKIESATYTDIAFRVLTANQHPDHSIIALFRQRHLKDLADLFVQVLQLCQKAGLVKLGHVSIDGTKILANASKHKAMSYERMCSAEKELVASLEDLKSAAQQWITKAEQVDAKEDETFGKGKRGDELPESLIRRESRLVVIRHAKAQLEEEARIKAREEAQIAQKKRDKREIQEEMTGKKPSGRTAVINNPAEAVPDAKAQKNFTDPESRIMKDGAIKSFVQGYNAQASVDSHCQIIVSAGVTQDANDKKQLTVMLGKTNENLQCNPLQVSADSGYFSQEVLQSPLLSGVALFISPGKERRLESDCSVNESECAKAMRVLLNSEAGKAVYSRRKVIVEPVFGQIKERRGFRRFSFRGLARTDQEWSIVCLTHNLLKLHRFGQCSDRRKC